MKRSLLEMTIVTNTMGFIIGSLFAATLLAQEFYPEGMIVAVLALGNGLVAQSAKKKKDALPKEN